MSVCVKERERVCVRVCVQTVLFCYFFLFFFLFYHLLHRLMIREGQKGSADDKVFCLPFVLSLAHLYGTH
jgi:hypothetical protein